jgi:hypothetical protein
MSCWFERGMVMVVVFAFGFINAPDERHFNEKERENTEPKSLKNIPVHFCNSLDIFSRRVFFGG